ncbi:MAG: flagellar biosynthesis protein FlhF [Planctomycetota bacterium]
MQIKTYRAKSIQQALARVRQDLGPDASVLHTRRVGGGVLRRWIWGEEIEVAATAGEPVAEAAVNQPMAGFDHRSRYREQLRAEPVGIALGEPISVLEHEAEAPVAAPPIAEPPIVEPLAPEPAPEAFFDAFTLLLEAEVEPDICQALIGELQTRPQADGSEQTVAALKEIISARLPIAGPITPSGGDSPRVAALVGPTGVGKTTTIAKLAANFRLRDGLRVGLITVDTYRVAAVEQLRTYADIIDLPMEVVATPREMRGALDRLSGLDLVLMDTAGRSPRDAVKVQELKSILAEANADEVHLVLSTTAGPKSLVATASRFTEVGVTSLLLTKLDEATGLGPVLSLTAATGLPISYLTNGQTVPDDIQVAQAESLADGILGASL